MSKNSLPQKKILQINRLISLTALLLCIFVSACQPVSTTFPTPTTSHVSPSETPTPTIVWFPPTATWTPFPTLTALPPTPEQRPGIGELVIEDDFSIDSSWDLIEKDGGSVRIGKNELTFVISKKRVYIQSTRHDTNLVNFYAEITANPIFCQLVDEYGMLLRVNSPVDYYRYSISCDGQVRLDRILNGNASSPQSWLASGSIPQGAPSLVRMGVWVVGSEFRFFINDDFQFSIQDGQIPFGTIGLFARSFTDDPFTVNFRDLRIWEVNH